MTAGRGGSRGWGADFQNLFFRSTEVIFRALPKHGLVPVLAFLGTFWKILTKKSRFFGARSPSKLVYIGAKGALRK